MTDSWYEVVTGRVLTQGDILQRFPVLRVESLEEGVEGVEVVEELHDVIVLTQSCDLENNKVDEVLVAGVRGYARLFAEEGQSNSMLKSKDFRKSLVRGNSPSYSLLQAREAEPALEWSLVDFHHLFSVSKAWTAQAAEQLGPRLRLVPPLPGAPRAGLRPIHHAGRAPGSTE